MIESDRFFQVQKGDHAFQAIIKNIDLFYEVTMLSINLDRETENYLADIISEENISSEELLKKLIYEHWQSLKPRKTLLQRRGGHPQHLLENAPPDLSLRENRKKVVAEYIQNHHQQDHS